MTRGLLRAVFVSTAAGLTLSACVVAQPEYAYYPPPPPEYPAYAPGYYYGPAYSVDVYYGPRYRYYGEHRWHGDWGHGGRDFGSR
jgi:hypothetical protein